MHAKEQVNTHNLESNYHARKRLGVSRQENGWLLKYLRTTFEI